MDGFGDVLGELFGGIFEVAGERGTEAAVETFGERGRRTDLDRDPNATTRYLAGGPRQLNINDL
jgi:hypothetical protein